MADSLLDNYNPLYDIHLRQYFASPHMQKHLQKMGLLESTLNLNGDEVYARHHAMMDMMLKNREAQLLKMAELRKKLDAAEKVEICRRIRTGQSPESYRRGKPSRSLSRNRAGQKSGGARQRRFSNSYEDRDFVQHIEERNADPEDYDTRDPYKRLSANAKRFNYLHKLDDKTLIAYKDNLKQQLQRLERFREISFGPHSVARQPPPPQASWFFRRRSVLNMRGRKATIGNKLNLSHDSRTSCPPTTRKRKDSNTRLPPINPQKGRVPTKPPMPMTLQQQTSKLPPAAKKPAPTRGRPSGKRQTTTTTTTITSVSKSPPITTTFTTLPSVTGHGVFSGAAAAATVAAIGTAALNMDDLILNTSKKSPTPSPPVSPATETRGILSSPTAEILGDVSDTHEAVIDQASEKEYESDQHVAREVILENTSVTHSHGDYDDSDSEPEYAEEDRQTPEETFARQEFQSTVLSSASPVQELVVETNSQSAKTEGILPNSKDVESAQGSPARSQGISEKADSIVSESSVQSPTLSAHISQNPIHEPALSSPTFVAEAPESPIVSEAEPVPQNFSLLENVPAPQSPTLSSSVDVPQNLTSHDSTPDQQSPITTDAVLASQIPVAPEHHFSKHFETAADIQQQRESSPSNLDSSEVKISRTSSVRSNDEEESVQNMAPTEPVHDVLDMDYNKEETIKVESAMESADKQHSPAASPKDDYEPYQSPVLSVTNSYANEEHVEAQKSPVLSLHSHHAVEHFEQHDAHPQSPVMSIHGEHESDAHHAAPESPMLSVNTTLLHAQKDEIVATPGSPPATESAEPEESEYTKSRSHSVSSSQHLEGSYAAGQDQVHVAHSPVAQSPIAHSPVAQSPIAHSPVAQSPVAQSPVAQSPIAQSPIAQSPVAESPVARSPITQSPVAQSPIAQSPVAQSPVAQSPVAQSPIAHSPVAQSPVTQSPVAQSPVAQSPVAQSPIAQSPVAQSPVAQSPVAQSPIAQSPVAQSPIAHSPVAQSPVAQSPVADSDAQSIREHSAPQTPAISEKNSFVPHSPSVHTSDASDHGEEEAFEVRHHEVLSQSQVEADQEVFERSLPSPTAADLYNPNVGNTESPVMSDEEEISVVQHSTGISSIDGIDPNNETDENAMAIADRLDLEAYHNSPTKESTSPVATNPVQIHITAEQVADQISSGLESTNHQTESDTHDFNEHESANIVSEAVAEAAAIIDSVAHQELSSPVHSEEPVSENHGYELSSDPDDDQRISGADAMTASIYQPSSEHGGSETSLEPETTTKIKEWDNGDEHVKETVTRSEFSDGNTHQTYSETVTVITNNKVDVGSSSPVVSENVISPSDVGADNISTDSLIIHDNQDISSDYQMTQSIYEPKTEIEEKEWDEGAKHVHEVISSVEHVDATGKHFTEKITTTTTVIKSEDDLENNNDDDEKEQSDDQDDRSIIEEEDEQSANGNAIHRDATTGLPVGGILVDDGDETNVSSL